MVSKTSIFLQTLPHHRLPTAHTFMKLKDRSPSLRSLPLSLGVTSFASHSVSRPLMSAEQKRFDFRSESGHVCFTPHVTRHVIQRSSPRSDMADDYYEVAMIVHSPHAL